MSDDQTTRVAGITFAHDLTPAEVELDLLRLDPDLSLLASSLGSGVRTTDGSRLRTMPVAHLRPHAGRPTEPGERVLVGPQGWIARSTGAPQMSGQRLGITLIERTLVLTPAPLVSTSTAAATRLHDLVPEGGTAALDDVPPAALGLSRSFGGRVTEPLTCLLARGGLSQAHGWIWRSDAAPSSPPTRASLSRVAVSQRARPLKPLRRRALLELLAAVEGPAGEPDGAGGTPATRVLRNLRDIDTVTALADLTDDHPGLERLCDAIQAPPEWVRSNLGYLRARTHLRRGRPGEALLALTTDAAGSGSAEVRSLVDALQRSLGRDRPVPRGRRSRSRWASTVRNGALDYLELTRCQDLVDARDIAVRDDGCDPDEISATLAADLLLHDHGGLERFSAEAGHLLTSAHHDLLRSWQHVRRRWWKITAKGSGNTLTVTDPLTGIDVPCIVPTGLDRGGRRPWPIPRAGTMLNARLLPTPGGDWLIAAPAAVGLRNLASVGDPTDLAGLMALTNPAAAA